jgi:uncharacterized protein YraI
MFRFAFPPAARRRAAYGLLGGIAALLLAACTLNTSPNTVAQAVISGAPVVRLASPLSNATYLQGVGVNIQALVSNAGEDIDRVEIAVNETLAHTLTAPNTTDAAAFSISHVWQPESPGTYNVGVTAFRADGSSSAPVNVSITVVEDAGATDATEEATDNPDDQGILPGADEDDEDEPKPTDTPAPTRQSQGVGTEGNGDSGENQEGEGEDEGSDEGEGEDEPEPTPSRPVATFVQGVNVRSGPGTNFNPPIGSFAAGQTADVLARNPGGDWYKVRYYNSEGWVFGSLMNIAGNTGNLPVDAGPPTPIPVTPTPVAPTATPAPATSANLVAGNVYVEPNPPVCNTTFNVQIDIANLGTQDTTATGTFQVRDVHVASGTVTTQSEGPLPIIKAGETIKSASIPLTVATYFNEEHRIIVTINPNGAVPETGSGDNVREFTYQLQQGTCG